MRLDRRQWLYQAGAITSTAAFPFLATRVGAQSQSTLNALPRVALIIGNTKYAAAPLKNPGNDAKALAAELPKLGFKVNLLLDTGREQLAQAITAFGAALAKSKGVGLFYYAGHGAQLGWRNYLIPVDAVIEQLEDMRSKTVDLSTLLNGITKAQNAMNLIILDACRDNPFGTKVPTEQKGLSQFEAPPGSLLAYATAPGNTAGDGAGANGLYTENLLREIRVPDAKIEDVMKRVRLGVRRTSQGQQIPWESTSLEDDFYFLPPREIKKRSEEELQKQFDQQKADWDKIKDSKNVDDVYAFLNEYPSGFITEQAAFRIEQLQKAQIAAQADRNGIIQRANAERFRVGDRFVMRTTDNFSGAVLFETSTSVEKIENGFVFLKSSRGDNAVRTLDGGFVRGNASEGDYSYDPPRVDLPGDGLAVGKKWSGRTIQTFVKNGHNAMREDNARVVAFEEVEVPLGKIRAYKIVMDSKTSMGARVKRTYWAEPGWGFLLKVIREIPTGRKPISETIEMVSRVRGRT